MQRRQWSCGLDWTGVITFADLATITVSYQGYVGIGRGWVAQLLLQVDLARG